MEFLHPHFRKICSNLIYYPDYESPMLLNLLHRYAVVYLISAEGDNQDLELLKTTLDRVFRTTNPSLFGEMVKLLLRLDDRERLRKAARGCLRFLGSFSEIKYTFLCYVSSVKPEKFKF